MIGIVSLLSIWIDLDLGTTMINFGALLGFTLVNVSVFVHYWVKEKKRGVAAFIKYILMPLIGACICLYLWANLGKWALIIGFAWLAVGLIAMLATLSRKKKGSE